LSWIYIYLILLSSPEGGGENLPEVKIDILTDAICSTGSRLELAASGDSEMLRRGVLV
jgi:hypothetical protein